jgi:hypothetical protein
MDQLFPRRLRNYGKRADGTVGAGAALTGLRRLGSDPVRNILVRRE